MTDADGATDLREFAGEVGPPASGPVTIVGSASRGGPVPGVRAVVAPAGVSWVQADEMTVCCGAGTPEADLAMALADVGQRVALPPGGTVGGALATGCSGVRRLGDGPMRDVLLQARYVSSGGAVVKAGGPTVKNVSGFDLCRLLVGSNGTLGFLGELIMRTRPLAQASRWFTVERPPAEVLSGVYRPIALLWDGERTWLLAEGHPADLDRQAATLGLTAAEGGPELPAHRWSVAPSAAAAAAAAVPGRFVIEAGVGVVHHDAPAPPRPPPAPALARLNTRVKEGFDPTGRLNPGRFAL